jgi:hypothetical protein
VRHGLVGVSEDVCVVAALDLQADVGLEDRPALVIGRALVGVTNDDQQQRER